MELNKKDEAVFDDIELLNAAGMVVNTIVASEQFAAWYAAQLGCTWRHRPTGDDVDVGA